MYGTSLLSRCVLTFSKELHVARIGAVCSWCTVVGFMPYFSSLIDKVFGRVRSNRVKSITAYMIQPAPMRTKLQIIEQLIARLNAARLSSVAIQSGHEDRNPLVAR